MGSCEKPRGAANQALIRGCPNGETHGEGSETSQYLEEKKTNVIPRVVASESGTGQTGRRNSSGVEGPRLRLNPCRRAVWKGGPQRVRAP